MRYLMRFRSLIFTTLIRSIENPLMRKALKEYLRAFPSHFTQTHLYLVFIAVCAFVSRFRVLSLLFPYYVFMQATLRFLSLLLFSCMFLFSFMYAYIRLSFNFFMHVCFRLRFYYIYRMQILF